MSIRIGGSCGGRYSRPILGITTYENRILQNNEHSYFWQDCKFCIDNKIFLIVNIDSYITGGRWHPTNQQLRDFIISVKNQLKSYGATKSSCRFTVDNESDEWDTFSNYYNRVRVTHDALNKEFDLGAGNFRTSQKGWYEDLASKYSENYYEILDVHYQDGLDTPNDITLFSNWLLYLKNTYGIKRISVTEGNNFWNILTEYGHTLLKFQISEAERIGCEDFCFVYANWMHNGIESDDNMSYNYNFNQVSSFWPDMKNFIASKKSKEVFEIMNYEINYVKPGSHNEETRAIQQIMLDEGYDLGPKGADSWYGDKTFKAIEKWQEENNLKKDGWVGPETWQWIIANIETGMTRFLQLVVRKADFR